MSKREPLRILLVEDDPAHAEIVRRNLRNCRVPSRIIHVEDGQAALDYLFRRAPYADPGTSHRPHLMLLDLRLPKVDGLELLRRINRAKELKSIPAIVISTSTNQSDIVNAYASGAKSYLVKPADCKQFSGMMEAFCLYWLTWNRFPP